MAVVTLNAVGKTYPNGFEAVKPSSFKVADGEFVVLVGPSGCGKSTLLRMVAGLEEITAGSLSIGDREVNDVDPADRDIAMVFQNYALYPHMTVRKNVGYGLKNRGTSADAIEAKVQEAATMLNLTELLDRKPSQLSGGQRQRVAMGRAVVRDPSLFLFDEPLSNLDAKLRNQMRIEIKALQRRLGVTSIYVTHDQVEAMTMADRIIVLNAGEIEQIGTPAEIYHSPASTFVASFMGAPPMNLIDARVEEGEICVNGGTAIASAVGRKPGPIQLGIRPEDVELGGTGQTAFDISIVEELGAHRLLHGQLGGQQFTVHVGKDVPAATGPTKVHLRSDALRMFDAETGKALLITLNVPSLSPVDEAQRTRILSAPRTVEDHRALLAGTPAMNAVQVGGLASRDVLPTELTVVTWNVERCLFPEETAAHLSALKPDIILLSEVDHGMARTRQRHTTEAVAEAIGMAYAFGVEFFEMGLGGPTERQFCHDDFNALGFHGNGVLSRVALTRVAMVRLDDAGRWFTADAGATDPEQPRIGGRMAILAEVQTKAGPLTVVSTHLESNSDATFRSEQFTVLLDALEAFAPSGAVVIGGDLNTGNHLPPDYDWRREGLFALAEERGFSWDFTSEGTTTRPSLITPHPDRVMKLDWIAGRGLTALDCGVLSSISDAGKPLSDHDAVWSRVSL